MAYYMDDIIRMARSAGASDIHISVGLPMYWRVHGSLDMAPVQPTSEETSALIYSLMTEQQANTFKNGDVDFAITTTDYNRQRVNCFHQSGAPAATIRLLNNYIPPLEKLGLPAVLRKFADKQRGLVLITGPTGSGKSTTLASLIDYINQNFAAHIITVEDPIEYMYTRKKAAIHQREVGRDVASFAAALRSALREDPDVILIGEMRDYETISAALTAAETGHLVFSTLHTPGAAQTIDRIINVCPPHEQPQIRTQLGGILQGVVTQCLIKNAAGNGRVVATEVLVGTDAVLNLIREDKCHQIQSLMQSGATYGMHTLNNDLARLVKQGMIKREDAFRYSNDVKSLTDYLP